MKLHELKSLKKTNHRSSVTEKVSLEPAGGIYGEIEVEVTFDYTGESFTHHGPDSLGSYSEKHDAELDIHSVTLTSDVKELDDEETGKTFKKGTDATLLPGWDKEDWETIEDKLHEMHEEYSSGDR